MMDHLALMSDVELLDAIEEESDPDTRELLLNEAHWRATAFARSQEAN
jgi:hypothetical protein